MARISDVVVDCAHPAALARFWASVLDSYAVAPYDDTELERLRAIGVDDPEDDPTVLPGPLTALLGPTVEVVRLPGTHVLPLERPVEVAAVIASPQRTPVSSAL